MRPTPAFGIRDSAFVLAQPLRPIRPRQSPNAEAREVRRKASLDGRPLSFPAANRDSAQQLRDLAKKPRQTTKTRPDAPVIEPTTEAKGLATEAKGVPTEANEPTFAAIVPSSEAKGVPSEANEPAFVAIVPSFEAIVPSSKATHLGAAGGINLFVPPHSAFMA